MKSRSVPHPVILLISAPSGAGKTTLSHRLLAEMESIRYSVSVTTREPRANEVDGVHYEFITRENFLQRVEQRDFLEHAEVHGNLYGTSWKRIEEVFHAGDSVLMDVDVQGARQIRLALNDTEKGKQMQPYFHDIFISPPSLEELRNRLEGRGLDAQEVIDRRLENAKLEMTDASLYEFQVVNDQLDVAYDELCSIYKACRQTTVITES